MVIKTRVSSEIHEYSSETNEYSFEEVLVESNEYEYSFEGVLALALVLGYSR